MVITYFALAEIFAFVEIFFTCEKSYYVAVSSFQWLIWRTKCYKNVFQSWNDLFYLFTGDLHTVPAKCSIRFMYDDKNHGWMFNRRKFCDSNPTPQELNSIIHVSSFGGHTQNWRAPRTFRFYISRPLSVLLKKFHLQLEILKQFQEFNFIFWAYLKFPQPLLRGTLGN